MKLISLTLTNFKGHRSFSLVPNGKDASVYGDNATGKSTIADAFYWLLFGKDSLNQAKFDLKTRDSDGNVIPAIEHTVEAELLVDGQTLTLKKTYRETYERKRGSATEEFTGHTTDYFINRVPAKEKDFLAQVAAICDETRFRLLTDPAFFNTGLTWQARRKMLLDVCGDISDADVIAAHAELSDLPAILGGRTIEEHRKVIAASQKAINDELKVLPARIDEQSRTIAEAAKGGQDIGAAEVFRKKIQECQERRATAQAGGDIAMHKQRLAEIEAELQQMLTAAREASAEAREAALVRVRDIDGKIAAVNAGVAPLRSQIRSAESEIARLEPKIAELRQKWHAENAKVYDGSQNCPACGQSLPEESVSAAVEEFHQAKSKRLADIRAEGKEKDGRIAELKAQIEKWKQEIEEASATAASLQLERDAIDVPPVATVVMSSVKGHAEKLREKSDVQASIASLQQDAGATLSEIDREIAVWSAKLRRAEDDEARARQRAESERRIAELKAREKELASQHEKQQHELFLTEEFIRAKVSMLTDRINSFFKIARFQLFAAQINGGLTETCELTVGGVPYYSLNTAMQINAGLDVIRTLSEHAGFSPPIFIDRAESVTSILATPGQQIRLIVSAADSTLRIETSAPQAQEALLTA